MGDEEYYKDSIRDYKESLKKKIKDKIKAELLEEIYEELKLEENDLADEISAELAKKHKSSSQSKIVHSKKPAGNIIKKRIASSSQISQDTQIKKEVHISVKAVLKIASHALKYASSKIPREDWVEVIGLLAGKLDKSKVIHIEDAYPMGHGTAVYAEIKDYNNYVRAFKDIKKQKLFICGWYHSHPSYGCFMSNEDMGTQARYQKLWDKAVALVIDPYQINGKSAGFEIYKADIRTNTWYPLVYGIEGSLDIKMLPEILEFMNPIIEGKAAYLEYDEE